LWGQDKTNPDEAPAMNTSAMNTSAMNTPAANTLAVKTMTTKAPFWKRAIVNIFDFHTAFIVAGNLIRLIYGNSVAGAAKAATVIDGVAYSSSFTVNGPGFQHTGTAAALVVGLTIAYFVIGRYFAGGTIWQRVFGTRA
jgi:hypothetical protein